ncbi:MAG: WG repeat-containing protein, partial [Rudanella sp.]|nr:WG repeat-containing protein [Rudanella sp.]
MTENTSTALIKSQTISPALARVSGQLAVTERLLEKPVEPILIPYRKGGKWGFCDVKGNIKIPCVYAEVGFFE